MVKEKPTISPIKSSSEMEKIPDAKLEAEYVEKFQTIKADALGIEINPNCFLQMCGDVDPKVIEKDEETARKIAVFLWDVVMPSLTTQIREAELLPKDSEAVIKLLHTMVSLLFPFIHRTHS